VYLTDLRSPYNPSRSLRSQNSALLVVPRISESTKGGRVFSHLAPKLWNSLPDDVQGSESLSQFKSRLKTHLFKDLHYGPHNLVLQFKIKCTWLSLLNVMNSCYANYSSFAFFVLSRDAHPGVTWEYARSSLDLASNGDFGCPNTCEETVPTLNQHAPMLHFLYHYSQLVIKNINELIVFVN